MANTKGMGKMNRRSLFIIFIMLLLVIAGFMAFILLGKEKTLQLSTGETPIMLEEDGIYTGSYQGFRWSNKVEVTVKSHKINNIRILKPQIFAKQETIDIMTQRILSAQSTEVDIVSGATADCKAYLKAVENALKQSKGEK
jgi:uncharacterized protein with FMN-binding domain